MEQKKDGQLYNGNQKENNFYLQDFNQEVIFLIYLLIIQL